MKLGVLAAFTSLWLAAASPSLAHNEWGLHHPSLAAEEAISAAALQRLSVQQTNEDARYVVERLLNWKPGTQLVGCFYNGSGTAKKDVMAAAADMLKGKRVNIGFDFGTAGAPRDCKPVGSAEPEDVRVAFEGGSIAGHCCWAFVGRASLRNKGPSVFLDRSTSPRKIQHELMHALGVHHEHQSPAAVFCEDEFDLEKMAKAWNFTEDQVRHNVGRLDRNSRRYAWSAVYDNTSIMKYYFSAEYLKSGVDSPCYSKQGENDTLSDSDVRGLRLAYPMDDSEVKTKTRAGVAILSRELLPEAIRELIKTLDVEN